jgi:LCP family protein required for cell wall assembly
LVDFHLAYRAQYSNEWCKKHALPRAVLCLYWFKVFMQNRKRTHSNGSAMDGFVSRSRPTAPRRASLETTRARGRHQPVEGFVPRNPAVNEPLSFTDETSAAKNDWSDENTLTIDPAELGKSSFGSGLPPKKVEKPPHFWQIFKKRRIRKGKPEPSRRKKITRRVIAVLILILILLGAFLGWKFLRATSKVFDGNVLGFFDSTKLKGEEDGRVNILLAGTSEDDADHGGADLTDSIMLVSIDTKNNTGFTVSIHRDLWVKYGERCSSGYEGKINVAYQCGNDVNFKEDGYAEGGMGLLQKIVSTNFGVPIQYYGKINYTAFKDAVDAVGGITLNIDSEDPRGIYDPNIQPKDGGPVRLKNGPQQLDGKLALALARSRNVKGGYGMSRGDFDRTTYQRAMLIALKDKALSAGVISNPAKLGSLLDAAGDNVQTNFKSNEIRRLYEISKLVKNDKIQSIDLASSENMLVTTGMVGPQSVVKPTAGVNNFSAIKLYFKKLTSTDPVAREGASVVVLNASGTVGLAQKRSDELAMKGISTVGIGNTTARSANVIVDLSSGKMPGTKSLLEKSFNVKATTNVAEYPEAKNYKADFVIILGKQSASLSSGN